MPQNTTIVHKQASVKTIFGQLETSPVPAALATKQRAQTAYVVASNASVKLRDLPIKSIIRIIPQSPAPNSQPPKMPELPEVETMVRGIRPSVVGRTIVGFRRTRCQRKPIAITPAPARIAGLIRGQTVSDVRRFGKRVLIELDDGGVIAIEPRMTGLVLLAEAPTRAHLRAVWQLGEMPTDQSHSLWFWDRRGLGTIRYYRPGIFEQAVADRLGPDALAMTPALWRETLETRRRPIKSALLDQAIVAGIGNLYASEILFAARIHPAKPANELSRAAVDRLAAAVPQILEEAIRHEGSTLADGTYRNALNQNGGYQNAHQVYARGNQPCRRCGAPIQRIVQAGRSTFFCPKCQRSR